MSRSAIRGSISQALAISVSPAPAQTYSGLSTSLRMASSTSASAAADRIGVTGSFSADVGPGENGDVWASGQVEHLAGELGGVVGGGVRRVEGVTGPEVRADDQPQVD